MAWCDALVRDRTVGNMGVGQRVPILDKDCDALIRVRSAGRPGVGQRVTKLKQGRDALICDRRGGQKDVRQRMPMPMLACGYDALIRDRRVGHTRALDSERQCCATAVVLSSVTSALVTETLGNE